MPSSHGVQPCFHGIFGGKIHPCSGDHRVVLDAASRVGTRVAAATGNTVSPGRPSNFGVSEKNGYLFWVSL